MKCPLFCQNLTRAEIKGSIRQVDCLKEECAWWLEDVNICAVKDLALEARYTQQRLQEISSKMPHEEQFRR